MATLEERMALEPELAAMVLSTEVPNRQVGRAFGIDESVIRRYRHRLASDPEPFGADRSPVLGQTVQWQPGLNLAKDHGEARTLPVPYVEGTPAPDDMKLLELVGADPQQWEVATRKESRWQNAGGEWLSSHSVGLARRGSTTGDLSVEQIGEILADYRRQFSPNWDLDPSHANGIFVCPIADIQAGKIDGGGTAALVDRFGRVIQEVRERLEKEGGAELIVIPVLGDCIEGIVSQGGKLVGRLDLSITEQVRVYRRLLTHAVAELAPFGKRVIIPVIPGNHDETYRIVQQPVTDSWAIEGASAVADALAYNPRYGHVEFLFPEDEELVITLNVGTADKPFVLAFTHGHLVKAPNSMGTWWSGQSFGRQQAGDADMLFTGHFHHLRVENMGTGRTWLQAPALDGGSDWYRRSGGGDEPVGVVSLWVTPGQGIGWEGLTFHTGE